MTGLHQAWLLSLCLLLVACGGTAGASPTPTAFSPTAAATTAPSPAPAASVAFGPSVVSVELAVTPEQQANGLSRRDPLPPGTGMLFPYRAPATLAFWMKDMRFPLDIIWIGPDCRVVDISRNAPAPPPNTPDQALPVYEPKAPAQYVLEVTAGEARRLSIAEGSQAIFNGGATAHGCSG